MRFIRATICQNPRGRRPQKLKNPRGKMRLKGRALKFKIENNLFSFLENFTFNFGSPCPRYLPEICPLHHKKAHFFDVQFVPKRTWQLSMTFVMRGIPAPRFYYKTPNASIRLQEGKPKTKNQNQINRLDGKPTKWAVNQAIKLLGVCHIISASYEDLPKCHFLPPKV